MDPEKGKQLTRLVWLERVRTNILAVLLDGAIVAAFFVVSMNVPVSSHHEMCNFQRISYPATDHSWSRPVAFCDLANGQTVMFRVPNGWVPPPAGSSLGIVVYKLVFGVSYRLA